MHNLKSDDQRHGETAAPTTRTGRGGKPAINESGTPEVVPREDQANDDAAENETRKKVEKR